MKELLQKTWNFLNGKKTILGTVSTSALFIIKGTVGMNPDLFTGLLTLTSAVFGVGAVHKAAKSDTGKKAIDKLNKMIK